MSNSWNASTPSMMDNYSTKKYTIGILSLIISSPLLILNFLVMRVIAKQKKLRSQLFYMVVLNYSVADSCQLFFLGLVTGAFCFMNSPNYAGNKISGASCNSSWFVSSLCANLLALNRFVAIVLPRGLRSLIFSSRMTKLFIICVNLYGLSWFIALSCPGINFMFSVDILSWNYGYNDLSQEASKAEFTVDLIYTVCIILCYACIVIKLRYELGRMHFNARFNNRYNKEMKTLIQASAVCATHLAVVVTFFILPYGFWTRIAAHFNWLCCSGLNPIIYLTFNSTIRKNFVRSYACCRNKIIDESKFQRPPASDKSAVIKGIRLIAWRCWPQAGI